MSEISLESLLASKQQEENNTPDTSLVSTQKELQPIEENKFSEKDMLQIAKLKEDIDFTNNTHVLQYGSEAQGNISRFSDQILESVRAKDSGHVGELLSSLTSKVEEFNESAPKKFVRSIPLVGRLVGKADDVANRYDKLSVQVSKISTELDASRNQMMKDIVLLDNMYHKNVEYFKTLEIYIEAGKQKVKEVNEVTLPKLRDEASKSSNPLAMQVVTDFEDSVVRFEKKVHDLELSRTIALQTAPQIRLIQNNDKMLVERVNSTILNTIPLWKNQMVIALGLVNQQKAIQMQKQVSDATNNLLRKNAEMLKQNTLDTARENERGIVDVETIEEVNAKLIETVQEVLKIQQEGRSQRQNAEKELVRIEENLKQALLSATNQQAYRDTPRKEINVTPPKE
jgi:telA-like protein SH1505